MYIRKIKKFSKVNFKFVVEALDIYLHKTILQKITNVYYKNVSKTQLQVRSQSFQQLIPAPIENLKQFPRRRHSIIRQQRRRAQGPVQFHQLYH